jgi:hypothetical protein
MNNDDRRSDARHDRAEPLLLRRQGDPEHGDDEPTLVRGTTSDVSAGGLRLSAPMKALPGEPLDVWISWTPNGRKYLLAGHVRWCSHMPNDTQLGVALTESPGTDYLDWRGLFQTQLRLVGSEGGEG